MQLDLVITEAEIYDGTGTPPCNGSVGIHRGKIVYPIQPHETNTAVSKINARGLAVAPGFINIHSHSDMGLVIDGRAPSALMQGITTEVIGNCGYSTFPLYGELREEVRMEVKKEYDYDISWNDAEGYFRVLEEKGIGVNVAALTGQGTLRGSVMGMGERQPNREDMENMKLELTRMLKQGTIGFSSGLIYPPSFYADTSELVELAKVAREYGGIYATHIRGESSTLLEAIEEALTIGRESGIPVEISHLKAAGKDNWGKTEKVLKMIQEARDEGIFVRHDQYPYTMSSTGLSMVLPDWVFDGGTQALLSRLKDPETRMKIRTDMEKNVYSNGDTIIISFVASPENKKFEGRIVSECAAESQCHVLDFIMDLLISEDNNVGAIYLSMCEEDVKRVMTDPFTSVGNDASLAACEGPLHQGKPHPRTYGTFPRVLGRYSRELQLFPMEEAIRKMTSLPAQILGFKDRGMIKNGYAADLVVFNPSEIIDRSEIDDPHRYPEGIEYVLVNGNPAVVKGEILPVRSGRILKHPGIRS